jgi:phage tail sheath gpL-like
MSYAKPEKFQQIIHLALAGRGDQSGLSVENAKSLAADADLWTIPAGTVIEKVYVIIDTAITGTTNLDIGDDDDADGFIDSSLSVTLGTAGMYGWDVKNAGAYLRVQTAGATDAADIYVVPNAKYYAAAGKEVKMDLTTAATAGVARVVIEGYFV